MGYNNVPVNGWPQIKDLERLDALAKQIDNMPTFTSNDRAFLEELPAFPATDGTKALMATTESGETSLSYEELEKELPADPVSDGVKVLTATTESGETVLSWEEPETSGVNYSTTEQKTADKWTDGKDIYCKVVNLSETLTVPSQTWTDTGVDSSGIDTLIDAKLYDANSVNYTANVAKMNGDVAHITVMQFRSTQIGINRLVLWYTKATT